MIRPVESLPPIAGMVTPSCMIAAMAPGDGTSRLPNRRTRVPSARTAWIVTGAGAALFLLSAVVLRLDATGWDERLYAFLNGLPRSAADALTPLSRLFLPSGLAIVVVVTAIYAVARDRSAFPLLAVAASAGLAWAAANLAKSVEVRVRPYEVLTDAVLRQDPASGTSFPSSHTAIAFAVAIALFPFVPRPLAVAGIAYATLVGWSRIYLGVHYPLDVIAGAGIGIAVGGLALALVALIRRRSTRACGRRRDRPAATPPSDPADPSGHGS